MRVDDKRKPKRKRVGVSGGGIRKRPDVQRVARALAMPGIDPRIWATGGTVGVLNDSGEFVTSGKFGRLARAASPNGVIISVRLDSYGIVIPARYHGMAVGRAGAALFPIMPGDEVLVVITDGNLRSAQITALPAGSNATAQIPSDWNNDRVLFDLSVPFQVRAPAIDLNSANMRINGRRVGSSEEPI